LRHIFRNKPVFPHSRISRESDTAGGSREQKIQTSASSRKFCKKITSGTEDRPGRYSLGLTENKGFGQQNAPASCSFPKKQSRVIKPEKYKDPSAIKKAILA
jgi:hypothetical protein